MDDSSDPAPKFLAGQQPDLVFTVLVNRRHVPVELFIMTHANVTYFFIQAGGMNFGFLAACFPSCALDAGVRWMLAGLL